MRSDGMQIRHVARVRQSADAIGEGGLPCLPSAVSTEDVRMRGTRVRIQGLTVRHGDLTNRFVEDLSKVFALVGGSTESVARRVQIDHHATPNRLHTRVLSELP